jgi:hypothetical protein
MNNKFLSGLSITALFYGIGYLIPILIQKFLPSMKSDMCNPGMDFFSIVVILIAGFIWTIISIFKSLKNKDNKFYNGAFLINALVIFILIVQAILH